MLRINGERRGREGEIKEGGEGRREGLEKIGIEQ